MNTDIFTDPTRIGPGIWFAIHIKAVKAVTDSKKENFILYINDLCDNFKCKKCQPHFRKFIDTHHFKNYENIRDDKNRDIGFFKWSWELHNEVNKFLGKYQPTLSEAYEYYSDSEAGACFNCVSKTTTVDTDVTDMIKKYKEGQIKPRPFKLISRN